MGLNLPSVAFRPIGVIRSGHNDPHATPIQPPYAEGCEGRAEILPEFSEGLQDLEGFSHLILIYHFHRAGKPRLLIEPFLQKTERGVFATRAPCRPNPIGMSIVKLKGIDVAVIHFDAADILDGTPLLDIKPYIGRFDRIQPTRDGWQDDVDEETARQLGRRNGEKV